MTLFISLMLTIISDLITKWNIFFLFYNFKNVSQILLGIEMMINSAFWISEITLMLTLSFFTQKIIKMTDGIVLYSNFNLWFIHSFFIYSWSTYVISIHVYPGGDQPWAFTYRFIILIFYYVIMSLYRDIRGAVIYFDI